MTTYDPAKAQRDFYSKVYASAPPDDQAVTSFLAPFLDQHPDGRPTIERHEMVSETGDCVYSVTAYGIMQAHDDPKALSDREVLFLVMTSDRPDTYAKADWETHVALVTVEARQRQAAQKLSDRKAEREEHDNAKRVTRRGAVKFTLPDDFPGTFVIPDDALSHRAKLRRTKSLKAAAERREKRRAERGIVISYRGREWGTLSSDQKREHRQEVDVLIRSGNLMEAAFAEDIRKGQIDPEDNHLAFLWRSGRMTGERI